MTASTGVWYDQSDPVTLTYVWKNGGTTVKTTGPTAARTDSLDLRQAGNGDKGDTITVEVTPSDGTVNGSTVTAQATVADTPPVAGTASITPNPAHHGDTLTAKYSGFSDADGDAFTYSFQWLKNGTAIAGATNATYGGTLTHGEQYRVAVTGTAGGVGATTSSDAITILNTPPVLTSAVINQSAPKTNDTLSVSVASSDVDGDARTYSYQWIKKGIDIGGATGATLDLSKAGNGDKGDAISVRVTASDGTDASASLVSAPVTIVNSAPVATDDSYTALKGQDLIVSGAVGVLADDTDADRDPLKAVRQTGPSHGTLTFNPDGSFTYSPQNSFIGTDSFTYLANDGSANSNVATVTLTVVDPKKTTLVVFSAGSASSATNLVTLTFTGALDGNSASNPANYSVDVYRTPKKGTPEVWHFTVISAPYNSTTHTVTLEVNGTLEKKDSIVVNWTNLKQAAPSTNTLNGQSPVITAK